MMMIFMMMMMMMVRLLVMLLMMMIVRMVCMVHGALQLHLSGSGKGCKLPARRT